MNSLSIDWPISNGEISNVINNVISNFVSNLTSTK